jgi:hypothetical protein
MGQFSRFRHQFIVTQDGRFAALLAHPPEHALALDGVASGAQPRDRVANRLLVWPGLGLAVDAAQRLGDRLAALLVGFG